MFSLNGDRAAFCQNILGLTTFSKRELSEVFPDQGEGFEAWFKLLKTSRMIERVGQYWIKNESLNDLIKRLLDDASWDQGSVDDEAEAKAEPAGGEDPAVADLFESGASDE
jgi:hypothetical protein